MRFALPLHALFASITILFCAPNCGEDSEGDEQGSDSGTPATLQCGDEECDTATQYCVTTYAYANDITPGKYCLAKPASCDSCDCLDVEQDFLAAHDANNCSSAVISCSNVDGAISAECQRSSSF